MSNQQGFSVASYCSTCGNGLAATAIVCPSCGSPTRVQRSGAKDKTVAVILAVFLGLWTWLYTYRLNATKFWTTLGILIFWVVLIFTTAVFEFADDPWSDGFATLSMVAIGYLLSVAFWLWPLIDMAVKPRAYFENYPS